MDNLRIASGSTRPVPTTLSLPKANGATTAELTVATGWNTTTDLDVVIYRRQLNTTTGLYEKVDGTQTEWVAGLTGTTLSSMDLRAGTEPASGYAADGNTVVFCGPTAAWGDDLVNAILTHADQDGTLKAGAVDNAAVLASDVVTTAKILNANVTNAKLASDISPAKFANPYKFLVYRNAAFNVTTSFAKVQFDTKLYDTGTNFDATTNFRFTAPVAGFYNFSWQGASSVTAADTVAALYKNGSIFAWGNESGAGGSAGNILMQASASDYFEVFIVQGSPSSAAANVGSSPIRTYFSGFLVSAT